MYAIIAACGRQYKVSEGDQVRFDLMDKAEGDEVSFDVLAIGGEGALKVGSEVASAKVTGKVLGQGKAKKIIVYKYKPKSGYHKKQGHRQPYTLVEIEKIGL